VVCIERKCPCDYNDEDKRKTNSEQMEELKGRLGKLESMISNFIQAAGPPNVVASGSHSTAPIILTESGINAYSNRVPLSSTEPPPRNIRPLPNHFNPAVSPSLAVNHEQLANISPGQQSSSSRFGDAEYERLQVSTKTDVADISVSKRLQALLSNTDQPHYGHTRRLALKS
jgi:hypothetical protein